jgi:hypothetical protein
MSVSSPPGQEVVAVAVQQSGRAPYASTGSIKTVIEKHRQVGLQTMSLQRLQQIGVTEALAPRTLQALVFLGFYDDEGAMTPEFDALRKVPEHDFKPHLAALLRKAYAPVLEVLDPATATVLDVENAFRAGGFEPTGQLPRMVQLFIGLMTYAELMPEDQRKARDGSRPPGSRPGTTPAASKKRETPPGGTSGKRVHETPSETPGPAGGDRHPGFTQEAGNTFILLLPSGPEMTLMVKMDVMRTSVEDRDFIFKIVDELREFADGHQAPGGGEAARKPGSKTEVTP